ncbi:Gfo/Idh/MocA family oxidoreductase [Candidatus Poribacteria bacterium]|nr:Gfo/Idh/MocA family oxidoreductase [Candidatus Poribacteria bacterium]MYK18775.1 Gfo/Idh/MocA family oxidoreductase [Candidatus Poribacteria bacterium]
MAQDTIRVGIIGAGGNTRSRHIPGLQAIEGVEIVGVCNRSQESSQRVADEFGIPKTYGNWQDAIADPDTNAIVIGTWPYMHCRATVAALEADKHVMCEARMAMNAKEAHTMRAVSRQKTHLIAQIVPSPMTLRVDNTIKRLISEGYIGDVLAIEARAGGAFLDSEASLQWRQDFDLSGLNIMSMGIWYEALIRWVGEATRIMAMGKTFVKMRPDADGVMRSVRIPEHIDVVGDLACGAQLHLQVSNVAGLAGAPEVYVFGSNGTLRFSGNRLYGGQKDDTELNEVDIPDAEAGAWRVEEEFVNAIRGEEVITHTDFETGVKYMEFTEAVTQSMQSGTAITLPLHI